MAEGEVPRWEGDATSTRARWRKLSLAQKLVGFAWIIVSGTLALGSLFVLAGAGVGVFIRSVRWAMGGCP